MYMSKSDRTPSSQKKERKIITFTATFLPWDFGIYSTLAAKSLHSKIKFHLLQVVSRYRDRQLPMG